MFHVKPRQIQPGALVPRRTGDAPGVQSIGQHLRRAARRMVAAPQSASRTAAPPVPPALTVLARRPRCLATRDSVSLASTPPTRLPVRAPEARAAPAKAVLPAARSHASRHTQVPVPRDFPANGVLADADRPAPTMAQPPVPCPLGQNLIPRCPAVQFLVGRCCSSARYRAAPSLAALSLAALS